MPMLPKRTKFRKQQRGRLRGNATRGNYVAYGDYGLQALQPEWLTARQIEAGRIAAQHFLRRQGKIYIRVFPDKPVSKSPRDPHGQGQGRGRLLGGPGPSPAPCSTRSRVSPRRSPRRRWPASPRRCPSSVDS